MMSVPSTPNATTTISTTTTTINGNNNGKNGTLTTAASTLSLAPDPLSVVIPVNHRRHGALDPYDNLSHYHPPARNGPPTSSGHHHPPPSYDLGYHPNPLTKSQSTSSTHHHLQQQQQQQQQYPLHNPYQHLHQSPSGSSVAAAVGAPVPSTSGPSSSAFNPHHSQPLTQHQQQQIHHQHQTGLEHLMSHSLFLHNTQNPYSRRRHPELTPVMPNDLRGGPPSSGTHAPPPSMTTSVISTVSSYHPRSSGVTQSAGHNKGSRTRPDLVSSNSQHTQVDASSSSDTNGALRRTVSMNRLVQLAQPRRRYLEETLKWRQNLNNVPAIAPKTTVRTRPDVTLTEGLDPTTDQEGDISSSEHQHHPQQSHPPLTSSNMRGPSRAVSMTRLYQLAQPRRRYLDEALKWRQNLNNMGPNGEPLTGDDPMIRSCYEVMTPSSKPSTAMTSSMVSSVTKRSGDKKKPRPVSVAGPHVRMTVSMHEATGGFSGTNTVTRTSHPKKSDHHPTPKVTHSSAASTSSSSSHNSQNPPPPPPIVPRVKKEPIESKGKGGDLDVSTLVTSPATVTSSVESTSVDVDTESAKAAAEFEEKKKELDRRRREERKKIEEAKKREQEEEERLIREEEDRVRRMEEEQTRLAEEFRVAEEEKLQKAILMQQRLQEEEKKREAEEERARAEREEEEERARQRAEREKQEMLERLRKDEEDRLLRKKRVEAIMTRTRKTPNSKGGSSDGSLPDDKLADGEASPATPTITGTTTPTTTNGSNGTSNGNGTAINLVTTTTSEVAF